MKQRFVNALTILLALIVGMVIGITGNALVQAQNETPDTWWFIANTPVRVAFDRDIDAPVMRWLQPGESVLLHEGYLQADDLIWAREYGTTRYVAVARYGYCEVESFGEYDPPAMQPISGVQTTELPQQPRNVPAQGQ